MITSPVDIDAETEKIVRAIGIPPCPKIVLEFMQEMRKDDADMRRLADLIGSDPGLAAAVLKTANSSMFALKSKVSTVQQAFAVLGMRATSMLVSSLLLKDHFRSVNPNPSRSSGATRRRPRRTAPPLRRWWYRSTAMSPTPTGYFAIAGRRSCSSSTLITAASSPARRCRRAKAWWKSKVHPFPPITRILVGCWPKTGSCLM